MARRAKLFYAMATLSMAALAPDALAQDDAKPPVAPNLTTQDVLDRAAEIAAGIAAGNEAQNPDETEITVTDWTVSFGLLSDETDPDDLRYLHSGDGLNLLDAEGEYSIQGVSFASAISLLAQHTDGNIAAISGNHVVSFANSANNSYGIMGFNQESGVLNSQGNSVALAHSSAGGAIAIANVAQGMSDNQVRADVANLSVEIANSFNNSTGIVGINQVAGAVNQQANSVAIAVGLGGAADGDTVVMMESDLAVIGTHEDNVIEELGEQTKTTSITNSFNNFTGIAQISQTAGNLNQVNNAVAMTYTRVGG